MKKYFRVFKRLENINEVKLASESSQDNFAFLTKTYEKLEHWSLSKSGGGGVNPLVPPLLPLFLRPCSWSFENNTGDKFVLTRYRPLAVVVNV